MEKSDFYLFANLFSFMHLVRFLWWLSIVLILNSFSSTSSNSVLALSLQPRPNKQQTGTTFSTKVQGVEVNRVPLRWSDPASPYCLVASSLSLCDSGVNFLATQVWPSARLASQAIEQYASEILSSTSTNTGIVDCTNEEDVHSSNVREMKSDSADGSIGSNSNDNLLTICEFGCGPGLPSLTAMKLANCDRVYATDIDPFALEMVKTAAIEQQLQQPQSAGTTTAKLETRHVDLISTIPDPDYNDNDSNGNGTNINTIDIDDEDWTASDLFLLADVFESSQVAKGAARLTKHILMKNNRLFSQDESTQQQQQQQQYPRLKHVWVFAQTDRAQREVYLKELRRLLKDPTLSWQSYSEYNPRENILWLCDVDETTVSYG